VAHVPFASSLFLCTSIMAFHLEVSAADLGEIREVLGPHASSEELSCHLGRFSRSVRKSVNSYFRSVCTAPAPPFDFQPRLGPVSGDTDVERRVWRQPDRELKWSELEAHLFPAHAYLDLRSVVALIGVSELLRGRVTRDDEFWSAQFRTVFAEAPHEINVNVRRSGRVGSAFGCFTRRWQSERSRTCPECGANSIVPIVHGFPSSALVVHHKKLLLLTEACGFLGSPWMCLSCHVEWTLYPYSASAQPVAPRDILMDAMLPLPNSLRRPETEPVNVQVRVP